MHSINRLRRSPLVSAVLSTLMLSSAVAHSTTWPVTSCNDSGSGTLRAVINNASTKSGDTADLSQLKTTDLGCGASTISLITGALAVTQDDLYIVGPSSRITISGTSDNVTEKDRIFVHSGSGTLALSYLNVNDGDFYSSSGTVFGGCIYSAGSLYLSHSSVSNCTVDAAPTQSAIGGGVVVRKDLTLRSSAITKNVAGNNAYDGFAGGALSYGNVTLISSSIEGNSASGTNGGAIGGLSGTGTLTMSGSTIANNVAETNLGGLSAAGVATIVDSTISGNIAKLGVIGGLGSSKSLTIRNSTIAFNTAGKLSAPQAAGFSVYTPNASITIELQSTVISNNSIGPSGISSDFSVGSNPDFTASVIGANNLVFTSTATLPGDTLTETCPLLGSLRDNGGPTLTHALQSGSPAIGHGNNSLSLPYDQRGAPSVRVSGSSADIGAYEVQQADIVFNSSFEGCP